MANGSPGDVARPPRLPEQELGGEIICCFYRVYDGLGYGFLESVYRRALAVELRDRGHWAQLEMPVEVRYRGIRVGNYRLDLLVEGRVAVEVKATELLPPTARRQLLNYLRASALDVGLLLHFGPKPRFHRIVSQRVGASTGFTDVECERTPACAPVVAGVQAF